MSASNKFTLGRMDDLKVGQKDIPQLSTSGKSINFYYVRMAKLTGDPNVLIFLDEHKDNPQAIVNYSIKRYLEDEGFHNVINEVAVLVEAEMKEQRIYPMISGGMRCDLIFSAPLAYRFATPHIAINKPNGIKPGSVHVTLQGKPVSLSIEGPTFHVFDLLNWRDSVLHWNASLQPHGAKIVAGIAVADRQPGKPLIEGKNIPTRVLVNLDEQYYRERRIVYNSDPIEETREYIRSNGVNGLLPFFDQTKLDRLQKFLVNYGPFLQEENFITKLEERVQKTFKKPLHEIITTSPYR